MINTNMNTTPGPATDELLEALNNEAATLMIPVVAILVIFMIAGLLGNGMVCFYYGCKTKRTTSSVFIVVLAVFDVITCSISIPIEIVDLRFFYDFENGTACKVMRFVNHFAAIGSAMTLMAIAIDRYRRICRPFKKQFNLHDTRIACGVAFMLALLLSWPAFVFYGAVNVNVANEYGVEIVGTDCTTTKDEAYRLALLIFNGTHLLSFVVCVVILIVLYSKVGRVIYIHSKNRQKYTSPITAQVHADHDQIATDSSELSDDNKLSRETNLQTANTDTNNTNQVPNKRRSFHISDHVTPATTGSKSKSLKSPDIKTVKYTMIMLTITIVFVVSFVPYLSLVIWRMFLGRYEADALSDSGLVAFQIGLRSYMLNSVINPITYGFFNSKFRAFFYATLCPCCVLGSRKRTSSTSST